MTDATVRISGSPPSGTNDFVTGNRPPLAPSAFRKLPIGAIKPLGWVKKQLELEADGFVGHLTEISQFLNKKDNAWLSPTGQGVHGWEEVPYWLKGFGDLGYVLGNARVTSEARTWIEGVIASQLPSGWFGPASNLVANDGKPDMWPNMVMLNALQSYYEFSADPRVLELMSRYFKWQLSIPDDSFYLSYWEKQRGGDNLASVYWLYNRTGDKSLLDLAAKIHRRTADWVGGVPDWHGVNFAQAFREPAEYAILSKDPAQLRATERDYATMRAEYGLVPGGMYGADENARPGYTDPRQATETCAMVEMMFSAEMLLCETGELKWAERCEDVTFNSLPASMTSDAKALHYLTAPNMPLIDARSKAPGLQNGGPMLLFDPNDHRCCQHNVAQGWPYYAEHLWLATGGNGLGVALYAPSRVTARVADGTPVTITESTEYPFGEVVSFAFSAPKTLRFPLTLRLPTWCGDPKLVLNGNSMQMKAENGKYAIIDREWHDGDKLELHLPMRISLIEWTKNKGAVSVQRGPLTYSLRIGEQVIKSGGTEKWPAYEIHPKTPWNYGLDLNEDSFRVVRKSFPMDDQPFDLAGTPIEIETLGRRIPQWQLDSKGLVHTLQQSPARSSQPLDPITLVPMGAARLRIASFPTVSTSRSSHVWEAPVKPRPPLPASASHVWARDTLDALSDGLPSHGSGDQAIPRFTWWDHKGTTEWVEYDLPAVKRIHKCGVYWFDDRKTGGGCRAPQSWRLLYKDASGQFQEVHALSPYGTSLDDFNSVSFNPVESNTYRIEVQLQQGFSGGILEWVIK